MTKLNIPRLPGESQEDFKRRYGREQMRAYRAAHPPPKKGYRDPEKGPRKNSPFTQEEWEDLRRRPDENESDWIGRNAAARHAKYAARHPERLKARAKAWYDSHTEAERARSARYVRENSEKVKESQRRYVHANKEKRSVAYRAWVAKNRDYVRQRAKAWLAANPGLNAHYSARWRRECRTQTPLWVDLEIIKRFYAEARRISERTGVPHEVDHIIPIQGRLVRGLHVHTNLRIIPASENSQKRNRLDEHVLLVLSHLIVW